MKTALIIGVLSFFALPLSAQESVESEAKVEVPAKTDYVPSGKKEYLDALAAKEKGDYEKALSLLEKASFKESNALYLFEYAQLLDLMGETQQALMVLERNADAMKAHKDITTYALVHQKFQNKLAADTTENSTSLVGPIVTVAGAATTVAGITLIILSNIDEGDVLCIGDRLNEAECQNPTSAFREQNDNLVNSVKTKRLIGWVTALGGVAVTSVGTYFWLNESTGVSTALNPFNNQLSIEIKTTW